MGISRKQTQRRERQRGATVIEFAFVFPILFSIVYAGVTYGYIYFLQQRINFAVEQAIRAAVSVSSTVAGGYTSGLQATATQAINNSITANGVLPLPPALGISFPAPPNPNSFSVTVTYSLVAPPVFPRITLPLVGQVPAFPDQLVATAIGLIS